MRSNVFQRFATILAASLLCLATALATPTEAQAQEKRLAVGGMFGSPTAFNFQVELNDRMAFDLAVGGGFFRGSHFYSHAQLLWKIPLAQWEAGVLSLNVGAGLQVAAHFNGRHMIVRRDGYYRNWNWNRRGRYTDGWFGVRAPVGVAFKFSKIPLDVFMEMGPGMYFVRHPDFSFTWATGARFWF